MSSNPSPSAPARSFASDNNAGVHPAVLAALAAANVGHARAYGDDPWTARAVARMREHFGRDADVHFVFGGTAANVLGLQCITQPYHAVICAATAHIAVDECGAPERFTGCKLLTVRTRDGKLRPEDLSPFLHDLGDQHRSQPRVVSISEASELGTVYRPDELRALADAAHARGLLLHVDGARLANAAAALDVPLRALTTDVGVDVVSVGGTKNGLMGAEAVVFPNGTRAADFEFVRKSGMQLASKMRFLAAQFDALFDGDLWLRSARHANHMAQRLARAVEHLPGVRLARPVEVNGVFVHLPRAAIAPLQARSYFYVWDAETCECRWMTSFDTTEEDVDRFADTVRELLEAHRLQP
ncbi:MAG: threonine aldolase [Planctomycetes bacterium]|nr:threonine aldolase [Planctomycetota bacterium]